MTSIDDLKYMVNLGLESNISTTEAEKVFYYHRGLEKANPNRPILVLLHGYPQSNFMWRHLVPLLPSDIPLFIPDVPGYGRSAPLAGPHDKRSTGIAILKTLRLALSHQNSTPIIITGHDRGARICHRLAVDCDPAFNLTIRGTILIDIVPTLTHWDSCNIPAVTVGSFHWPFLANVEVATMMIKAQGGDVWTRMCLDRWVGRDPIGAARFKENDAIDVYATFMKEESVIRASCDDYRAGAYEDAQLQKEDQKEGRKLDVDVLALYSASYLGSRYDMKKTWGEWMGKGSLEVEGVDNSGHFIAEEAPDETAAAVVSFYNRHV